ncbi:MAG: PEP/pyruvate-binding domain-containing protein, partial [Bacteroidales bacterium]
IDIEHIDENSFAFVGNKAANFGVLYHISKESGFRVPESAFAIPFFFYHRHVSGSQASVLIDSLMKCSKQMSTDSIKLLLIDIREKIKASPIDISLLNSINSKVLANDKYLNLRFRSSTNAEDAKGFSGAGIYTSKTGIYKHSKKTYEKAIKDVWASLWSYEAFVEREYYNIRHEDAYMGILVHRSFPDEKVNGVAITKNLYRPQSLGFVVNAQIGDESVVEPKQGITSDQFICYPDAVTEKVNAIDIITQSNLHENSLVMSPEEIKHLANQLEIIKRNMYDKMQINEPYEDFGLDLELKLESEKRILYIKQVRLYND